MKLLRLKLDDDFRSLRKGFELYFLRDFDREKAWDFAPYALAGRNGHGKSNVLEVLANIFYHIECTYLDYKPDNFEQEETDDGTITDGFTPESCKPDAFELEYLFPVPVYLSLKGSSDNSSLDNLAHILIKKKNGESPAIWWLNKNEDNKDNVIQVKLNRVEVKYFLPDFIVGYASGENEILSLPFFKMRFIHFDEYKDRLTKKLDYSKPEGRMIFLDAEYSQAILIGNYLLQPRESLNSFIEELGIEDIAEFRLIINIGYQVNVHQEYYETLSEKQREDESEIKVELTNKLEKSINKLKSCATAYYEDLETNLLYLDYFVNDETKNAFKLFFENPVDLFQNFQILLTLNTYQLDDDIKSRIYKSKNIYLNQDVVPIPFDDERIFRFKELRLLKKGVNNEEIIYTRSLSDGEHQMMHAIGLCLLFRSTNALFLLDEPETHFNPDWKAKFATIIRNTLSNSSSGDVNLRDILIASHSPFLVSDCKEENVLLFSKISNSNEVTCTRPDFNTFGASVNKINIKLFEQTETIGDLASSKLDDLQLRFEKGDDIDKLIQQAQSELGDSIERIFFISKLLEKKNK